MAAIMIGMVAAVPLALAASWAGCRAPPWTSA
jgi:hypothetical protein